MSKNEDDPIINENNVIYDNFIFEKNKQMSLIYQPRVIFITHEYNIVWYSCAVRILKVLG